MNKTKIEWCDRTWNPVTGCLHGCEYCYARRIAKRFSVYMNFINKAHVNMGRTFVLEKQCKVNRYNHAVDTQPVKTITDSYPYGFAPTFHRYLINEPSKIKKPQNIFVCSMADLFGDWVPDEWIEEVFKACEKAPHHRYLFLTKNPKRYLEFLRIEGDNYWLGITITTQKDMEKLDCFYRSNNHYKNIFISVEPILEGITLSSNKNVFTPDWLIIGAETGNRKGKIIPERKWIENIVNSCEEKKIPVFMKNNLKDIWGDPLIQEYPW